MKAVWLLLAGLTLAACANLEASPPQSAADCASGPVRLYSAAMCTRTGPTAFSLAIRPEAEPINPSPWYAFDIEADRSSEVSVTLDYGNFEHRYRPKERLADGQWRALPAEALETNDDGARAALTLSLASGRTSIAAQDVLSRRERAAWAEDFARRSGFALKQIGESPRGHTILALHGGRDDATAPLVLILGGQHPPEVPGTLGLRAFLETLAHEGAALLETHRLLIVPELNPDGVEGGYWRLNAGLVDLNRDWGPFSQPETQAVKTELDRLTAAGARPVLMLDFHATRRTVFYTPSHEDTLDPPNFPSRWLEEIDRIHDGEQPEASPGHNSDNPTAKVWFAERYGAPGITVEYGDETDRAEIDALSAAAARALVTVLTDGH